MTKVSVDLIDTVTPMIETRVREAVRRLPHLRYADIRLEITEAKGSAKRAVLPFPGRYSDEDGSGLTATVKPDGPNDFDFKLTKDEAKAK